MSIKYGQLKDGHLERKAEGEAKASAEASSETGVTSLTQAVKRGRPKGSNNYRDAKAIMEQHGDPLVLLLKFAHSKRVPLAERVKAAAAACAYCHPRLTTTKVDISGQIENRIEVSKVLTLAEDPRVASMLEEVAIRLATLPNPTPEQLLLAEPHVSCSNTSEPASQLELVEQPV